MPHLLAFARPAASAHSTEMAFIERHHPAKHEWLLALTHTVATSLALELAAAATPPEPRPPQELTRLARLATIGRPRPVAARVKRKRPRP